jgi:hypothetical protein
MAQKVIRETICDLTGEPADETVEFGLADKVYRIDLTKNHADGLREILADYIRVAQPIGKLNVASGSGYKARATSGGVRADREQLRAIREWAKGQGLSVSDRGRISSEIRAKFDAAHADGSQTPAHEPHRAWA